MAEVTGRDSGGRNTMIVAIVAILLVAAIAIWATTRRVPAEKRATTTTEGTAKVGDRDDNDVELKVNLPDSVTIEAH
jgi:hypothetical protein